MNAIDIDPTQKKDQHCKIYLEKDVKEAVEVYQSQENLSSFSEAGRRLILIGIEHSSITIPENPFLAS